MEQDLAGIEASQWAQICDRVAEPLASEAQPHPALILIVEDDASQRLLMRKVLEHKGFEVIDAADGKEACQLNEKHRPDLLLVDLVMPNMDGYELCRELRSQTHSVSVPIVVTTSRDDMSSIVRAYDAGATDFVPKPINWLVLSQRIHHILRASRAFADLLRSHEQLVAAEDEVEPAEGSAPDPSVIGDEIDTPPNAMIGVSGMLSDRVFDVVSDKPASSFEWIELDTLVTQIAHLQAQRSVAKLRGNLDRVNTLSQEIEAAMMERERLVAQIGRGIAA
jgi:DNA-binding response OmpR family regulator